MPKIEKVMKAEAILDIELPRLGRLLEGEDIIREARGFPVMRDEKLMSAVKGPLHEVMMVIGLLADHAKALIDERPWLASQGRYLEPGDIMLLLRNRGELASLLVAQLHERGVPVAGIDRLRLAQPLVVGPSYSSVQSPGRTGLAVMTPADPWL